MPAKRLRGQRAAGAASALAALAAGLLACLRRAIRLELHQPHAPTPSTGTTYISEMYQCVMHASGAIATAI